MAGILTIVTPVDGEPREESDFHDVPRGDRGNESYRDRGMLGNYGSSAEPFREPADVKMFAGFGATEEDLHRGYCQPGITEDPAYDKVNYQVRWTLPKVPDEGPEETNSMMEDYRFRARNERSKGFLTRPRIPTERN